MHIRYASAEDIERIQAIAHKTWPVAYGTILTSEQLEYMLALFYSTTNLINQITNDEERFILGIKNEMPVGFASFSASQTETNTFHLNKLYVMPDVQGKSVGKDLLLYVEDAIRSEGAIALTLNVNRNNNAVFFYQKMGFETTHQEDIHIGNGYFMNDFVMKKSIG